MDFITETHNDSIRKYARFTVKLLSILVIAYMGVLLVVDNYGFPYGLIRIGSLTALHFLAVFAEKRDRVDLAKALFIGGLYWATMIYPFFPIFNSNATTSIFLYIFILLVICSLTVVVYRSDEWKKIVFWVILTCTTFYFGMYSSIQKLEIENPTLAALFSDNEELVFSILVCGLVFSLITWVLKIRQGDLRKMLRTASVELSQSEQDINVQNTKLNEIAIDLKNTHLEIARLNGSLEERISKRSADLEAINTKIVNHGFMHSKLIKSAFESNVLFIEQLEKLDEKTIHEKTKKMTTELDRLVYQIAENLEMAEKNL